MRTSALVLAFALLAGARAIAAPSLAVSPARALADAPVHIVARALGPRQSATISATTVDAGGASWSSEVTCTSNAAGIIDLDRCLPRSDSSYQRVDGMGLFWSMRSNATDAFFTQPDSVQRVRFTLSVSGGEVAHANATRVFADSDVRKEVLPSPMVGNAYVPSRRGEHPAVILLGGSGGGHPMDALAALLASHGYETISLAYYGDTGLPKALSGIPVETVGAALAWLEHQPNVDRNRIAIIGHSRGSELALETAASYPEVHAVIALAGSPLMWPALDRSDPTPRAAWTFSGKPLPYVPYAPDGARAVGAAYGREHVIGLRLLFTASLANAGAVDAARIPIERIQGPILFIAGDDDAMWPSTTFASMAMGVLHDSHHAYRDESAHYANAGHWMFEPYIPVDGRIVLKNQYSPLAFGGTIEGDAAASVQAWHRMLEFLGEP